MAKAYIDGKFHYLNDEIINKNVEVDSIGVYILLDHHAGGLFKVCYVGRSDKDLNDRLKKHVGSYEYFHFEEHDDAYSAYEQELAYYNNYPDLDNKIKPAKP